MAENTGSHPAQGCPLTAIMGSCLALFHILVGVWLSFVLFGLAGGIETEGRWTRYGGIDYAWANLAWLPGGLLLPAGDGFDAIGLLLMICRSGVAGFSAAECFTRILAGVSPRFGPRGSRLWVPLALWFTWVPVPVAATLTYWYTVAY
jgi:hypothetical protein